MRGAFGVMAAGVATAVVAAWRRVQREGIERRLAARSGGEAPATTRLAAIRPSRPTPPTPNVGRGAEPADSIRIVRRGAGPSEPGSTTPGDARAPERAPGMRRSVEAPEPAAAEAVRAEPARAEPLGQLDEEPARERVQEEPPAPFPAEAPERGREEPPEETIVPPVAWDGGAAPLPARVPRPIFWPAVLALGVTWAAWGAISSPLLIFGGLAVFVVALTFWIREMTDRGGM